MCICETKKTLIILNSKWMDGKSLWCWKATSIQTAQTIKSLKISEYLPPQDSGIKCIEKWPLEPFHQPQNKIDTERGEREKRINRYDLNCKAFEIIQKVQ